MRAVRKGSVGAVGDGDGCELGMNVASLKLVSCYLAVMESIRWCTAEITFR